MRCALSLFLVGIFVSHFSFLSSQPIEAAIIDTYYEDFDNRQSSATIDAIDNWAIEQGTASNATVESTVTATATGSSLKIAGAVDTVIASRSATYGDLTPCWIEFLVRPSIGAQRRAIPSNSIAALSFDYNKIYATDGSSWIDTGVGFNAGEWYRLLLNVNFKTHTYDIYIQPLELPKVVFVPDKEDLNFIDTTIDSLSQFSFAGVYNTTLDDTVYIDNIAVYFIDRIEFITPPQTLTENQVSEQITVQLQNANSEPQTAWRDITIELKSSSGTGEFSLEKDDWKAVTQVVIPENSQTVTFYYKDLTEGKPIISCKEYPDSGWTGATQQLKVVSKGTLFDIVVTTPQVAGEYFPIEIIAKNDDGEVNEYYTGGVNISVNYISPASGTMLITPDNASGFTKGRQEVHVMYPDCGTIEIVVQDKEDESMSGSSPDILFLPARLEVFAATPQVVNKPFKISIDALNSLGQFCPNYKGPVTFSAIAVSPQKTSGIFLPATIEEGELSGGRGEVNTTFNRWGIIKIDAHDTMYPEKSGVSEEISFNPSAISIEPEPPPAGRDFYYMGENIKILVSALDELKGLIPNYEGLINLDYTMGLNLPNEYRFAEIDAGRHQFLMSASSAGTYKVIAEDSHAALKAETPDIKVKQATLEVVSTTAPIGTTEVIIRLMDEDGNVISSENTLGITVTLEEEAPNSSAKSNATHRPVVCNNGVAMILVSNDQPETVTIAPSSIYNFKIKKGTVVFGRLTKTGIGTLMWREVKD